jgi:hypothetical protein
MIVIYQALVSFLGQNVKIKPVKDDMEENLLPDRVYLPGTLVATPKLPHHGRALHSPPTLPYHGSNTFPAANAQQRTHDRLLGRSDHDIGP